MHRMYVSISAQDREVFEDNAHNYQMEIALAMMEERVARMVDEIKTAKSNVATWRKMCGFMMCLLCVMLVLLLAILVV
jgi:succinate dehydrogenase/fumarate reductase-like Fe-S protein